jgi:CheY-like chemotaxis protein
MSLLTLNLVVADTSPVMQRIFQNVVAKSPLPVELTPCGNGKHCADLLMRGGVDIAFVEMELPDLSGIEVLRRARAAGVKSLIGLMALKSAMPSLTEARELHAYEFLEKPFAPAAIEAVIANYRRLSAPMTVLMVDDSPTARRVMRKVLAGSIFQMSLQDAGNGDAAIAACEERPFDLVFLDCNMPGISGLETLQELRKRNPAIRVIMISGDHREEVVRRAAELGAAAFLRKPFFTHDIDRALHVAFDLRVPQLIAAEQAQKLEHGYASLIARKAQLAGGAA